MGGIGFKVGHGFVLLIPVMTFYTWNWNSPEGKGVEHDRIVKLSLDDLQSGPDNQLEKAVEISQSL